MQHPTHPDDERLAALAGGDPEVTSDGALRAHVDSCDRCAGIMRELGSLRAALAELPDLVPSRRLRLLPPVDEPRAPARSGWLRRLAGPAMAAGFVLVAVGAVGSSGFSLGMASSAAPSMADAGNDAVTGEATGEAPEVAPGAANPSTRSLSGMDSGGVANRSQDQESSSTPHAQPAQPSEESGVDAGLFEPSDPRLPWLVVLGLGVGLLLAGIYLRFAQQPRAG